MNPTDEPTIDGIARRTFIKGGALLGATALLAGGTGSVAAQQAGVTLESELEGPITAVDVDNQTIEVMGITANVEGAPIASPTASLTIEQLLGDPLPGRTESGFMGGTGIVVGTTLTGDDDYTVDASSVTVEVAENVIVGAVTENTLQGETFDSGGSFAVQGVEIRPTNDDRIPFSAGVAGLPADMSTVPVGSLAGPEGHIGNDGVLYAHTLEVEGAELINTPSTSILRVRCEDGDRLEIRGASSTPSGSVTVYDDSTGAVLGTAAVEPDEELGIGSYRFRRDVSVCPMVVRVENSNGSSALFNLPAAVPVPEEPEEEEPPENEGPTHTLDIQGSGSYASYSFTVDGEVTGGTGLTSEDLIDDETATGAVRSQVDSYTFTGDLLSFTLNGDATVMLDGAEYTVDRPLSNTLTVRGSDDLARYSFTVSGDLAEGGGLTGEDTIDGSSATGAVRRGQDTYFFEGDITEFAFEEGAATVIVNGQVVDPADLSAPSIRSAGGWMFQ